MNMHFSKYSRYIDLSREIAGWSKDPSTKVGAVVVSPNGRILTTGYNGFPNNFDDNPDRYEDRRLKYHLTIHAEMNCIYNASKNGISLEGSILFISGLPPCEKCALGIVQAGIKTVVVGYSYENPCKLNWMHSFMRSLAIFEEAKVVTCLVDGDSVYRFPGFFDFNFFHKLGLIDSEQYQRIRDMSFDMRQESEAEKENCAKMIQEILNDY